MSPMAVVLASAAVAGLLALGLPALLRSLPAPAQDPPSVSYRALAGWRPLVPLGVVVSTLVAAGLAWRVEPARLMLALTPLVPLLFLLAYVDWRVQRLPKVPILVATAVGLVLVVAEGLWLGETEALLRTLVGLVLARSVFWLLWRIAPQAMGFGDVRLAALVGLVLAGVGWTEWMIGLWAGLAIFGVWGVARAVAKRSRSAMREPLAYGPFMIAGMLAALLAG